MLQLRSRETLDGADHGWLKARYHFAVTANGNRANGPLGSLIVWNDDQVAPGTGFPRHSHADMEIITYVREGAVTHEDSKGNVGTTVAGDVQVMSAGTGISHAERNVGATTLKMFQIWLLPRERGVQPRWESRRFPKGERAGQLVTLASGDKNDTDTLYIGADARIVGATLLADTTVVRELGRFRHAYLAPTQGVVLVNGYRVATGDGIAAIDEPLLTITAEENAEFVLVEAA
jgi:quercetin 2,3-dioxygenase